MSKEFTQHSPIIVLVAIFFFEIHYMWNASNNVCDRVFNWLEDSKHTSMNVGQKFIPKSGFHSIICFSKQNLHKAIFGVVAIEIVIHQNFESFFF